MSSAWIWAQMSGSVPGRQPTFNPPLVPWVDANGIGFNNVKLGTIPDPDIGDPLNQFCLVFGDASMGAGAAWSDLPPLDQAIWLYAAGQHPDDTDLAAAIPPGAVQPALSPADAGAFANAQAWLNTYNAPATTTGG